MRKRSSRRWAGTWPCPPRPRGLDRASDGDDALATTSVPVLVTHGREDTIVLPSMAEHTLDVCEQSVASWYDDVGHMPFWEESERFDRELSDLRRRTAGAAVAEPAHEETKASGRPTTRSRSSPAPPGRPSPAREGPRESLRSSGRTTGRAAVPAELRVPAPAASDPRRRHRRPERHRRADDLRRRDARLTGYARRGASEPRPGSAASSATDSRSGGSARALKVRPTSSSVRGCSHARP